MSWNLVGCALREIELKLLTTGEVHAHGSIPKGTANLITGGVFVGSGVHAQSVVNEGPTTTCGPNDMVLDNWGKAKGDEIIVKGQEIAENKAVPDYDFSAPPSVIGWIEIGGKPITCPPGLGAAEARVSRHSDFGAPTAVPSRSLRQTR